MKHTWRRNYTYLLLMALPLFAASTVFAQTQPDKQDNPPVRGVRLSDAEGNVQLFQGAQKLTDTATANITLYEGYRLTSANDGRAEIQFDEGSLARLTPDSTISLNLLREQGDQTETEVEVNNGLAYFELKHEHDNSGFRVKFGDTLVTATQDSTIRVDFDNAPGSIAVFTGEVHVERPSGLSVDVHSGQSLTLNPRDATQYTLAEQIPGDSWDQWNHDRDLALAGNASQQTPTSQSMAKGSDQAWNDLDANGTWYNVPDVGPVWSPADAAYDGWDPYGNGYWLWTPRFGYTWVSAYGWGYLPYRCGLWNWYDGFGWGWAPGFGGCNPWYVGGFWFGNFGLWPRWYHFPHRPVRPVGFRGGIAPRIAVNHNYAGGRLIRPVNGPVSIAGHTVTPIHPIAARASYGRFGGAYASQGRGSYSQFNSGGNNGYHPYGNSGGARPSGGSQPHYSAPASGHPSGGGGSSHPSGGGGGFHGGGGGGGGGSHGGGGGGHH